MGVRRDASNRALRPPRRAPGRRQAVVLAVIVHAVLLALIVVGIRWQSRPPAPAQVIQAKAVNDAPAKKERERAEQEAKKKRDQQERERKATEDKRRAAEQAKAAEQKRQDDAKRRAADTDKKRKEQQHQADLKRKQDAEERRQAAEQNLKEQLVSEEKERADAKAKAEQAARAQSELTRYEGLIRQKVERNWVRPVGWAKGMECTVRVRLAPTGEVIQATVIRPSGNPPFDRSVENAVYKASPLPLPEDQGLFDHFRELELRFRPEGLT